MEKFGLEECWTAVAEDYEIIVKVGQGSYGQVYKAKNIITGETVAIKHM